MLYSQNLQKQTPILFQTGGRAPGAPVLDPPLYVNISLIVTYIEKKVHRLGRDTFLDNAEKQVFLACYL